MEQKWKIQRSQCCELTLASSEYFCQKRTKESAKHQLVSAKFIVVISSCTALIPFRLLTLDLNHFSGNIVNKPARCTQIQSTKDPNSLPRSSTSFFFKGILQSRATHRGRDTHWVWAWGKVLGSLDLTKTTDSQVVLGPGCRHVIYEGAWRQSTGFVPSWVRNAPADQAGAWNVCLHRCLGQELAWVSTCQNSSSACWIYTSPGTEESRSCKLAFCLQIYILFLNCIFYLEEWSKSTCRYVLQEKKKIMFYFFCWLI